jgi:glyoxylase-like metal-dependent hydrolase (beta-lactamase superfamily II)
MEIVEGIHRVDEASRSIAHSNFYLTIDGPSLLIVDTGLPGNAKKTIEYIQKIGRQPTDVSTIILTHYHVDHTGSLKELQSLTKAKVAVHADDADYVSGNKPLPKPKNLIMRVASSFMKLTPTPVDTQLKEGDRIGRLTIIHTPGHTPGSIALLDTERKALFVGDTLRLKGDKIVAGPEQFVWDAVKEKESIRKIASLDFNVMLPGHGEPLKEKASEAVKKFSETRQ